MDMQHNQIVSNRNDDTGSLSLRALAAATQLAIWAIQPANSPDISYEGFESHYHASREVIDWLIERIKEKYGVAEVWNAHVERELVKLSHQILLDQAYEAVWLVKPVDIQGIAEQYGIDQEAIEEYVQQMVRTRPFEHITNGDILLFIAQVRADQVSYPGEGGNEVYTVKTDPAYLQYLAQRLRESAFLSSPDVDTRIIAHYYGMMERQVKQVMASIDLQEGGQLTNRQIVTRIDLAGGDWLSLGLLPDTNELLSIEEASRLGIPTPSIPCECGEPMYKGDGTNTLFGPYCSEECVHRYVCMGYVLAGFVTDEDVANPSHPIYHWVCKHEASPRH